MIRWSILRFCSSTSICAMCTFTYFWLLFIIINLYRNATWCVVTPLSTTDSSWICYFWSPIYLTYNFLCSNCCSTDVSLLFWHIYFILFFRKAAGLLDLDIERTSCRHRESRTARDSLCFRTLPAASSSRSLACTGLLPSRYRPTIQGSMSRSSRPAAFLKNKMKYICQF
jgi:hypothetical protein